MKAASNSNIINLNLKKSIHRIFQIQVRQPMEIFVPGVGSFWMYTGRSKSETQKQRRVDHNVERLYLSAARLYPER